MTIYLRRPFHIPEYEITADCSYFMESLCLQYGKYINNVIGDNMSNVYKIIVTKKSDNDYMFEHIGGMTATADPLYEIDEILFNTTTYDSSILALHGAAVEYNGYAYIFLAPTTTGKTTLTAYLTNDNFGYITEDCILIDRQTLTVYPYACPVHLRSGGVEVLQRYGITIPNMQIFGDPAGTRYVYTPSNCVTVPLPLGRIYFIERGETENRVTNMSTSASMIELMKSPITVYPLSGEYIRLISTLAKVGCKRVIYRDMEYIRDIIIEDSRNEYR